MERLKKIANVLLHPHWIVILVLSLLSAALLVWIFLGGYEESRLSYPVYVVAAYTLTVGCIALIPVVKKWYRGKKEKKENQTPEERKKKLRRSLYLSLCINGAFGVFKIGSGLIYHSPWLWSSGIYYMVLCLIRLVLALYERRIEQTEDPAKRQRKGWEGFRTCGFLLLPLNVTMSGMAFQMIWRNTGSSYGQIVTITIAAYTFYRLTMALIQVFRLRKKGTPLQGAVRNISLTEAMMALFSLQTALFATYGAEFTEQFLMNILTGGTVCLLAVLGALGMALHGSKRIRQIAEGENNGKE